MRDLDALFAVLRRSAFRSRFQLNEKDASYLQHKGWVEIEHHARDFVHSRLASAMPVNDGKQTPMRGHPVFTAQHATATCCRKCLLKWHKIPRGRQLRDEEIDHVVRVVLHWLNMQSHVSTD